MTAMARGWLWRRRHALLALYDGGAWAAGLALGTWFRYSWRAGEIDPGGLATIVVGTVALQWLVGGVTRLYSGRHATGSLDDSLQVSMVVTTVGTVVFAVNLAMPHPWIPRSVPLTAVLIALVACGGARLAVRLRRELTVRPDRMSAERVVIFGAGRRGQELIRSMLCSAVDGYLPVAVLDDDPDARHRRIAGVPVLGTQADIGTVAHRLGASLLVVALPEADAELIRQLSKAAADAGLGVKLLPPLKEMLQPHADVTDLRDLDMADLLGRHQVDTEIATVADYLVGKRVLVTGAGGSIGSELCRQINGYGPAQLLMLDRDESALHAVSLSLYGRALLDSPDVILADIRDSDALGQIFDERRPEIVFHAAALKHLPMLEQYPAEAWKTNVVGTLNVLEAAERAGVRHFINISTDKAANPTSMLGYSKRVGERLTAQVAAQSRRPYVSVRFGNVLGSRGSVIVSFREQIAAGGPVTVTHPDVTRFFMTVGEAVQLVIYAAAVGRSGEALVLDMGTPVRIDDVARQLIALSERPVRVVYTGLRGGEKLTEELFGYGEVDERPVHPSISHVDVPALHPGRVRHLGRGGLHEAAALLAALCAEAPHREPIGHLGVAEPVGSLRTLPGPTG